MRHEIFPTPLWHIEGAPKQVVDDLYQAAYQIKKESISKKKSNEGGYQSSLIGWKNFHPEGREYIEKILKENFKEQIQVISWWININGKGHWNTPHTHSNADFALVLYLTDSDGLLRFMSPHHMRLQEDNGYATIDAKKGDILMFPSDIIHYVTPNPKEEDRISISMNLQLCEN